MMVDLAYVQLRGDTYRYRRRVPLRLQQALGKRELIYGLGKRDRGFLGRYEKVHAQAEALLQKSNSTATDDRTPLEWRRWAEREIERRGLDPEWSGHRGGPDDDDSEDIARGVIAESIIDRYAVDDEGDPVGVTDKDAALLRVLISGRSQKREAPTLEDAKRLYLKERVAGTADERKKEQRVVRVIRHVEDALRRKNPTLASLTKLDALTIRDHIQGKVSSPATVRRYLNDLRALIACGIDLFGLSLTVTNPFHRVTVKMDTVARDERHPFSRTQLEKVRARVLDTASDDLQRIWRLLAGTGCRLAEVTGLLTDDVVLDHPHPHLDVRVHPHRRLKTKGSVRKVPLVGDALKAAREAKAEAVEEPFLFARYHDRRGADAASSALMKHVRACVADRKVTVHSLRHNMRDALLAAGVEEVIRDMITGHTQGKEAERYGGDEARLEVTSRAMRKALLAVRLPLDR